MSIRFSNDDLAESCDYHESEGMTPSTIVNFLCVSGLFWGLIFAIVTVWLW